MKREKTKKLNYFLINITKTAEVQAVMANKASESYSLTKYDLRPGQNTSNKNSFFDACSEDVRAS